MGAPLLLPPEVAGAIARRTGAPGLGHRAVARLNGSPALRFLPLDRPLTEDAARLAADLRLRGADAAYVAVARRWHVPLLTWDREQAERAAAIVEVRAPTLPTEERHPR